VFLFLLLMMTVGFCVLCVIVVCCLVCCSCSSVVVIVVVGVAINLDMQGINFSPCSIPVVFPFGNQQ